MLIYGQIILGGNMESQEFTLETLKDARLRGYMMFTDAEETGGPIGEALVITDSTMPGVDEALMQAGFEFTIDNDRPKEGLFWMQKSEHESLRYRPLGENKLEMSLLQTAADHGMKTRIDFFCHAQSDCAYDVASELLKLGYKILVFSPHECVIGKVFLIELDAEKGPIIREANESTMQACARARRLSNTIGHGNDLDPKSFAWLQRHTNSCENCKTLLPVS